MAGLVGIPFAVGRAFARGTFLVEADQPATRILLIKRGQVRIFRLDEDGREVVTAVLGAGHLVGVAALLGHARHSSFAQATTRVETWSMPVDEVLARLAEDRTLLGLIAGGLAQRFALAAGLYRDVRLLPVLERLVDIEARLATTLHGEAPVLSQAALAHLIQARPETVARKRIRRTPPAMLSSRPEWAAVARHASMAVGRAERSATHVLGFSSGDEILATDLPAHQVAEVISGRVQLSLINDSGREVAFEVLQPGDMVAVANLVGMPALGMRAVGLTRGALRIVDVSQFLTELAERPERVRLLATRLAARLDQLEERLAHSVERIDQRLLTCLRALAEGPSDGLSGNTCSSAVHGVWSHAHLAQQIGVARETITRTLARLETKGAIHREGRRITLTHGQA
jgi:CRP-like cAMP-binding protein